MSGSVSEILRRALGTSWFDGTFGLYRWRHGWRIIKGSLVSLQGLWPSGVWGLMVDVFVRPGVDAVPT